MKSTYLELKLLYWCSANWRIIGCRLVCLVGIRHLKKIILVFNISTRPALIALF
jgi:hypothetical protein